LRANSITATCMPRQMPKNGHPARARSARFDLSFDAAAAEAGRHQDAVHVGEQRRRAALFDLLGVDVVQVHAAFVADAAVDQRLVEALVRFDEIDVLCRPGRCRPRPAGS
jgi:hypothetical protein